MSDAVVRALLAAVRRRSEAKNCHSSFARKWNGKRPEKIERQEKRDKTCLPFEALSVPSVPASPKGPNLITTIFEPYFSRSLKEIATLFETASLGLGFLTPQAPKAMVTDRDFVLSKKFLKKSHVTLAGTARCQILRMRRSRHGTKGCGLREHCSGHCSIFRADCLKASSRLALS